MNIEDLVNKTYIIKVTPNLSVKAYMIIKKCGVFKFVGKSRIDNMDMYIVNSISKRKIKINKLLNNDINNLSIVNTTLKDNLDKLDFNEVTNLDLIRELNQM